jgi:hypothetical protein
LLDLRLVKLSGLEVLQSNLITLTNLLELLHSFGFRLLVFDVEIEFNFLAILTRLTLLFLFIE